MKADGLLAVLDRWGRAALPGAVLLFFVVLTLAPLRAPYLSDSLATSAGAWSSSFSQATPERLPGPACCSPWASCSTCCWAGRARRWA